MYKKRHLKFPKKLNKINTIKMLSDYRMCDFVSNTKFHVNHTEQDCWENTSENFMENNSITNCTDDSYMIVGVLNVDFVRIFLTGKREFKKYKTT